jgi:hypothetical protein
VKPEMQRTATLLTKVREKRRAIPPVLACRVERGVMCLASVDPGYAEGLA